VHGDLRFIAHRDTLRLFGRALTRAGLPVAYSRGFNPHLRVTILVPRSVGMAADADYAVVQFADAVAPDVVCAELRSEMPAGASVLEATALPAAGKPRPASARYRMALPDGWPVEALQQQILALQACPQWLVTPADRKGPVDLRRYLADVVLDPPNLYWTSLFVEGRSASPRDLCGILQLPWDTLRYKIVRTSIELL
jgi:radical SAM-linked protein